VSGADIDADLGRMEERIDNLADDVGQIDSALDKVIEVLGLLRMSIPLPQRDRFDELMIEITPTPPPTEPT
jgi:hypothetical protein